MPFHKLWTLGEKSRPQSLVNGLRYSKYVSDEVDITNSYQNKSTVPAERGPGYGEREAVSLQEDISDQLKDQHLTPVVQESNGPADYIHQDGDEHIFKSCVTAKSADVEQAQRSSLSRCEYPSIEAVVAPRSKAAACSDVRPKQPYLRSTSTEAVVAPRITAAACSDVRPKQPYLRSTSTGPMPDRRSTSTACLNERQKQPHLKTTSGEVVSDPRRMSLNVRPKQPYLRSDSSEVLPDPRSCKASCSDVQPYSQRESEQLSECGMLFADAGNDTRSVCATGNSDTCFKSNAKLLSGKCFRSKHVTRAEHISKLSEHNIDSQNLQQPGSWPHCTVADKRVFFGYVEGDREAQTVMEKLESKGVKVLDYYRDGSAGPEKTQIGEMMTMSDWIVLYLSHLSCKNFDFIKLMAAQVAEDTKSKKLVSLVACKSKKIQCYLKVFPKLRVDEDGDNWLDNLLQIVSMKPRSMKTRCRCPFSRFKSRK